MRNLFGTFALVLSLGLLSSCQFVKDKAGALTGFALGAGGGYAATKAGGGSDLLAAGIAVVTGTAGAFIGDSIQAKSEDDANWKKLMARSKPYGQSQPPVYNSDGSYQRTQTYIYRDEAGTAQLFDATHFFMAPEGGKPPELDHIDVGNWRPAVENAGAPIDESKPVQNAPVLGLPPRR